MEHNVNTDFAAKNTLFFKHTSIQCKGKLIKFDKPLVMGILNVTPDSFYDGGKYNNIVDAVTHASSMIESGADIIDIGAVSTRPGSKPVSIKEEENRLLPVIEAVRKKFPDIIISADTHRSKVSKAAIKAGADIINDISGGTLDNEMFDTIAELQVPYILMHIRGKPEKMHVNPQYDDVTAEVIKTLADKSHRLKSMGVNDIIIDPGFGFGKSLEHNYKLLRDLEFFQTLNLPLLVGVSRKSMVYKPLEIKPMEGLTGTIALNFFALTKGANIIRVHDVEEAVETIKIFLQLYPDKQKEDKE